MEVIDEDSDINLDEVINEVRENHILINRLQREVDSLENRLFKLELDMHIIKLDIKEKKISKMLHDDDEEDKIVNFCMGCDSRCNSPIDK